MICPVCAKAADEGRYGMYEHSHCKSLTCVDDPYGDRTDMCDCQHKEPMFDKEADDIAE